MRAKSRTKSRKPFSITVPLVFLAVLLVGGGVWLRGEIDRPQTHQAGRKTIVIEPGMKTNEIIARLQEEGVLAHEWPMRTWLRIFGGGEKFKAGDYRFRSPISPRQVINQLMRGEVATRDLTIPEGYNLYDIAHELNGLQGVKPSSPAKVEELLANPSLIADLDPEAKTLEGYLFPDTYEYTTTTTREQLVEAMIKRFRKVYTPEMQSRASELGMTTRQVVTLASLIEKEAKVDSERELISSVFHRRLKMNIPLACDPTVIYAALLAGRYRGKIYQSDLDRNSPYNTYRRTGLPPGPIASPGKRSIEAALNPAETDYLFFVVDAEKNDGSHKFSASSTDHERAVKALRQAEKK